jgi:hypothetical protein
LFLTFPSRALTGQHVISSDRYGASRAFEALAFTADFPVSTFLDIGRSRAGEASATLLPGYRTMPLTTMSTCS